MVAMVTENMVVMATLRSPASNGTLTTSVSYIGAEIWLLEYGMRLLQWGLIGYTQASGFPLWSNVASGLLEHPSIVIASNWLLPGQEICQISM